MDFHDVCLQDERKLELFYPLGNRSRGKGDGELTRRGGDTDDEVKAEINIYLFSK